MNILLFFFSFRGLFSRLEWWISQIIVTAIYVIARVIESDLSDQTPELILLVLALYVLTCWVGLSGTAKRLRDAGYSPWMCLLGLIPLIGGLILLVICGFFRSKRPETALAEVFD
jgi:uncharacterized membrane protein YhaH (DUF805 family)